MRRAILLISVLALVTASCSSGTGDEASVSDSSTVTTSSVTTSAPIDGPPAPDFTLALGNGGEFTLSAEQKPVYLVFWAEW